MKIIKKIKAANVVQKESMLYVLGSGARSNINRADGCDCRGSYLWNDNTNTASFCFCSGNGDNSNGYSSCKCS